MAVKVRSTRILVVPFSDLCRSLTETEAALLVRLNGRDTECEKALSDIGK
jgi:hypothetical protein